jgi:hypothetical protein
MDLVEGFTARSEAAGRNVPGCKSQRAGCRQGSQCGTSRSTLVAGARGARPLLGGVTPAIQ